MLIAYGSFLLAEHFHASGVLATLTAGLFVGNWGFCGSISEGGKRGVLHHWEYVAFLINSLIFMLIGGREADADSEHVYDYLEHGGTAESARQLGVDEHAVVKTLVMQNEKGEPLIVLMHGDQQVSTKNLARAIGTKSVEPCTPEAAERASGYQVGGTSPFATRKAMPVYVEATILGLDAHLHQRRPARLPDRHRAGGAERAAAGDAGLVRAVSAARRRIGRPSPADRP